MEKLIQDFSLDFITRECDKELFPVDSVNLVLTGYSPEQAVRKAFEFFLCDRNDWQLASVKPISYVKA